MIILPAAIPFSATTATTVLTSTTAAAATTTTTTTLPSKSRATSCLVSPRAPSRFPSLHLVPPLDSHQTSSSSSSSWGGSLGSEVSSVPLCFVKLPVSPTTEEGPPQWWPCFYLPRRSLMAHIHETLYMERRRKDPTNRVALEQEMKTLQQQCSLDLYHHCRDVGRPVWLLLGRTSQVYPFDQHVVSQYLTVQDDDYLPKCQELMVQSRTNPRLQRALEEFVEYRQWTRRLGPSRHSHTFLLPPRPTVVDPTAASCDPLDSATVVTAASEGPAFEDSPSSVPTSSSSKKNRKRPSTASTTSHHPPGPKKSRTTTPVAHEVEPQPPQASTKDHLDDTPVTAHKRRPHTVAPPSTTTKFNRQALEEAQRGPSNSPRSTRGLIRREVFPSVALAVVASPLLPPHHDDPVAEPQPPPGDPALEVPQPGPHDPAVVDANAAAPEATAPTIVAPWDEPPRPASEEPEPLPPVDLPGRTVREKLQSCLDVLRNETESVVKCRKIVGRQRQILQFINNTIHSRATHVRPSKPSKEEGPHPPSLPPIMHVCGAPGSGKTVTVEDCGRIATEQFLATCEDYQAPPKVVYLHCSHLRYLSTEVALQQTLASAKVTERDLKNNSLDEDRKPVVIFVLDEIDYLVSTMGGSNHHTNNNTSSKDNRITKTEKYLQKLIEWATNESYLVGLLGISNSVENLKAKRLEILGFPRENKIVFQTYDSEDLSYIALSRIGSTVVEASSIRFISKAVANSSGDARRYLEILSRTLSYMMESMSEEALNAEHQGPVVKLAHVNKILNQSIMKSKDLLVASPALDKHVLCLCLHLVGRVGSTPVSLHNLLWLFRECYRVVEMEGTSHLMSTLERLVDGGLLKLKDKRITQDKIHFDEQLDEVESAVRDVLMSKKFYQDMAIKLQSIPLTSIL